jgi:hypothetical protein
MIHINMDKAREIHKDRMREARAPLLVKLDVEYQRALETNSITLDIVAKKNLLRDVTKDTQIALASTPEELKAVWPSILNE